MQLKILLIIVIALAVIACSGCLTETKKIEVQDTVQQNSMPFMAFGSGFHYQENWSGIHTCWMQTTATLHVNSSVDRTVTLGLNAQSFYRNRTLEVYAGDELLTKTAISSEGFVEIDVPVHLAKGINVLRLCVPEGCERPSDIKELNSTDGRCLSVAIQNVALGERKSGQLKCLTGFYHADNWSGTPTQWMQTTATLLVNSSENRTATLTFNAQSFYRNRTLEISTGGAPATQVAVPTSFTNVSMQIHLAKGANTVHLRVPEGCERPSDIKELNSTDGRCLSVAIQNLDVS